METNQTNHKDSEQDVVYRPNVKPDPTIIAEWTVYNLWITFFLSLIYFCILEFTSDNDTNKILLWTGSLVPLFLLLSMILTYLWEVLILRLIVWIFYVINRFTRWVKGIFMHYRVLLEKKKAESRRKARVAKIRDAEKIIILDDILRGMPSKRIPVDDVDLPKDSVKTDNTGNESDKS